MKLKKLGTFILGCSMALSLITPVVIHAEESYAVNITKMEPTPYIRDVDQDKDKEDLRNDVTATIQNDGATIENSWAKMSVGDVEKTFNLGKIETGTNTITIPVIDTNKMLKPKEETTLTIEIYDNKDCAKENLRSKYVNEHWKRTRHWEFYLSQTMHTDLGYTMYQESLKDLYSGFLDTVKSYMKNSDDRETDIEKYHYAIESGFVMGEGYMARRNADDIQELLDLEEKGRLSIGAGRFNYVMEGFTAEETARAAYYTNRYLKDALGIKPSSVIRMFDNPAFSKSFIDIAAQSGIKYGIHSQNPDRSPYHQKRQYDVFYMQGNEPNNKMLIFNGKSYAENYGFGGSHGNGAPGSANEAESSLLNLISHLESRTGERGKSLSPFPYDKFLLLLIPYGDNKGPMEDQIKVGNALNKKWADEGLVYPKINADFPEKFFEELETEYKDIIPVEKGTEENWWNDGWGTTAYESGVNKEAGNKVPVAETSSALNSLITGAEYPVEDINEAVERNIIYDEHTWGAASYDGSQNYHDQFEWKRSNAFGANALADKIIDQAIASLAKQVNTDGTSIYVYNPLNWSRNDVVTIDETIELPENFVIKDGDKEIAYTRKDGKISFVAPNVPALGYKTFKIEKTDANATVKSKTTVNGNTVENDFYKVTFADDGTIASIIDKKNDNREIVDASAEDKFNQYIYYDDHGVPFSNMGSPIYNDSSKWTKYSPKAAVSNLVLEENEFGATATLDTSTFRANSITQKVTLYDDIARIDIENIVEKESTGSLQKKEEAFYAFPFKASDNYKISYDLPLGNVEEGSQVYGTSHDWYTANKWVSVKDGDYTMSLGIPNTALVQFGERRTGAWSFDYVSEKPYIYSYVMNNMWQTNFQGDQPGNVSFKYSIMTGKEKQFENTAHFGWEVTTPLQSTWIDGAQVGKMDLNGSYITISEPNVQMTTLKSAESNGEGMILRLHEMEGKETTVTVNVPFDKVTSINETDIIENDKEGTKQAGNSYTIKLPAYGMRTLRLNFNDTLGKVNNVKANTSAENAYGENLSLKAAATANSEFSGQYVASNALKIDGSDWATKGTIEGTLTLKWNDSITASTILIQDRLGGRDFLNNATLIMKLKSNEVYRQEINDFRDDQLKTLILDQSITLDELILEVKGSDNVGVDGIELYEKKLGDMATFDGTKVTWDAVDGAWYYEVFRSNGKDTRYLGYAENTSYFDTQVTGAIADKYSYQVRAVGKGTKGEFSGLVEVSKAGFTDTSKPGKPIVHADVRNSSRIDLHWTPVLDDTMMDYYEIVRDGEVIGTTRDAYLVSYRDRTTEADKDYKYVVNAVDKSGKKTASDQIIVSTKQENNIRLKDITVSMGTLSPEFNPDVSMYNLHLGKDIKRVKPVEITATTQDENDVLTINGKEVASGEVVVVENLKANDMISIKVKGEKGLKVYAITVDDKDPIIKAKAVTADDEYGAQQGAINIINDSGMSGTDSLKDTHDNHQHGTSMWHTDANPGNNASVQIDLGKAYPLDEMWIWNMNQSNNIARGLKNVKIEYSEDETTWIALSVPEGMEFTDGNAEYPFQLAQASGKDKQPATNLNDGKNTPVKFGGVNARYVKITAAPTNGDGSWGQQYFGLSEVRFTSMIDLYEIKNVESITVTNEDAEITTENGTLAMEAKVLPEEATEQEVNWSVMDAEGNETNLATITADGVLKACHNGTVYVVASAQDESGVTSAPFEVTISGQSTLIENITAVAENVYPDDNHNAINLVNNSGMSGNDSVADLHDDNRNAETMWHTDANPKDTAVVTFDLGGVQAVGDMWIWNMNQSNNNNRGLRNVKIEYRNSEDEEWQVLDNVHARTDAVEGYPFTLAKASGKPNQSATNLIGGEPIAINKEVRYVRLSAHPEIEVGSYGSEYFGLSEVRFTSMKEADQALLNVVVEAQAKEEETYTATSWKAFEEALTEANRMLNTAFASDDEVELATSALQDAMDTLEIKPIIIEREHLKGLIDATALYVEDDYTTDSWSVFAEALALANEVYANETATVEEVRDAFTKLDTAIKQLEEKPVDKNELQTMYDEFKGVEKGNYTDASWAVFQKALENAEFVLHATDATQDRVDAAVTQLNNAKNGLTEKPVEPTVDKSDLQKLYDEYKALDKKLYTEESWEMLTKAMNEAEKVLDDTTATQKDVDIATGRLQNAYEALKHKPTVPTDPDDGNGGNTGNSGNGGNTGNSGNGGNNNGSSNAGNGTNTGDTSSRDVFAGMLLLSGIAMLVLTKKRKNMHN